MHYALFDKFLQHVFDEGILPASFRPTRCKSEGCNETKHFHRHGSYARKSVFRIGIGWVSNIRIQRFRCARCKKAFSLILPTHYKWQRADLSTQQGVIENKKSMHHLLADFSNRTLYRWKQKWHIWAEESHAVILQWLLRLNPGLSLDASPFVSSNPLRYIQFLLDQFSQNAHSPIKVTSVAKHGGWSVPTIPQCLTLSLPMSPMISSGRGMRASESYDSR